MEEGRVVNEDFTQAEGGNIFIHLPQARSCKKRPMCVKIVDDQESANKRPVFKQDNVLLLFAAKRSSFLIHSWEI